MGYSSNIEFKVTVVLKKYSSCPVSLIIHSDAKNDSKIYEEILQELKRRRLLRKKQVIYFNKYYYSMENYLIGIKEYNIITIIFPRQYFRIEKLEAKMSTRLDIFYDEKKTKTRKRTLPRINNHIIQKTQKLEKNQTNKRINRRFQSMQRCIRIRKIPLIYTKINAKKHLLMLIIISLIVQQGFKTKTQLQKLSEGIIDYNTTEPEKTRKIKKTNEKTENKKWVKKLTYNQCSKLKLESR